jgi:hypothetical protein
MVMKVTSQSALLSTVRVTTLLLCVFLLMRPTYYNCWMLKSLNLWARPTRNASIHTHIMRLTVIKLNFLFYYQKARSEGFFRQNILSAWQFTGLISYNPDTVISKLSCSKTSLYATFINEDEVQINVSVTPHTATWINEVVSAILKGMTSSLHVCVLDLKNTALTAVVNKTVLQWTNQELLDKQQQQWNKQSRKAVRKAQVLTVDKERAIVQKKKNKKKNWLRKQKDIMHWGVRLSLQS